MREPPFRGGGGVGGKEYIHTRMAMDGCAALRCNGYTAMDALRYNAMRCNGMEMGRDFAVVVCCFFLLFKARARLIGAAAAGYYCYCWLLAVQVHNSNAMQWN